MADETQSTEPEQDDVNPATENQSPASVVTVYDSDGREHFAAPASKWVVDGLADGTLTEQPPAEEQSTEEVPSGTETGSTGDDPKPGTGDGGDGSEDGTADAAGTSRRRRAGQA
jgi:hypothetical protein